MLRRVSAAMSALAIAVHLVAGAQSQGYLGPTNPPWPPTYSMRESSLTMQCNGSGWSSPARGAEFGIVSYDWSNDKKDWAMAQPMDAEERLLHQATLTHAANPKSKIFVYRNLVWAMPWFSSVREKLDDPAYSGFFLKFDPARYNDGKFKTGTFYSNPCDATVQDRCSPFYHDQNQSPAVPSAAVPHPDGACPPSGCDCGKMPCGGYLWDHRNASLQKFLIDEFMLGPTGLGSSAISGFFIDDFWCSDLLCKDLGCSCGDPRQGPSEIVNTSQADMGLTDRDIKDITIAWNNTMGMVERATLEKGGYTWSLMRGENNANASPQMLANKASVGHRLRCAAQLKEACMATSIFQTTANLFGVTFNSSTLELTQLEQDVAFFLLARGEYAWIGWGTWGMTWPFNAEPAHGTLPALPHGVPKPPLLSRDFGAPVDKACRPVSPGVFERRWTKGVVQLDCNTFTATLPE